MKRKWYTEPQIELSLQQAEAGTPVAEICRKMGVCGGDFLPLEEALRGALENMTPDAFAQRALDAYLPWGWAGQQRHGTNDPTATTINLPSR